MRNMKRQKAAFIFGRKNYTYMSIGLGLITLGYIFMTGGGSADPNVFNEAMFNFTRTRLAPFLVLTGLGIEIYAIMRNPA
ncbi:MAG: DUF3098 domain-containing protein [Flavobacteriales bacterium]